MLPIWLTDTVTSDIDRTINYTLLWGLEGVELRTVGVGSNRVPYINEEKIKRRLAEDELPVVAVVPGLFEGTTQDRLTWMNEVASLDETLQFCQRMGCSLVVTSGFAAEDYTFQVAVDALKRAGKVAAKRNITLAVLNEPGMAHTTGKQLAALLEAVEHSHVQAAWNPAAAVQAAEDPHEGLNALAGHIALVRCRNGNFDGTDWTDTLLDEGAIDWQAQADTLKKQGFRGPVSLEVHVEPKGKRGVRLAGEMIRCLGG